MILLVGVATIILLSRYKIFIPNLYNIQRCSISAVVLPHYNGAKQKRTELIQKISSECQPQTIVLLSPNHYSSGSDNIITTDETMNYYTRDAQPNNQIIQKLVTSRIAENDKNVFLNEHGIKNVMPELAQYFPNSKFIPIIVKQKTDKSDVDDLYNQLQRECADCLIIASVDFSHSVSPDRAREQDQAALASLEKIDPEAGWQAVSDSPQSLYIATKWARQRDSKFYLFYKNNSGIETKTPDEYLVSYILGYFK